jgi:hypothetical protein
MSKNKTKESQYEHPLKYVSDKLKNDKQSTEENDLSCMFNPLFLESDRKTVIAAAIVNVDELEYASNRLKNNNKIVKMAVNSNGSGLKYAAKKFNNNRKIIMTAVTTNGDALKYASNRLRADRDIVLKAVQNCRANSLTIDNLLV